MDFEGVSCEHLLRGDDSLRAFPSQKRDRPVEKDGKPVLEASQRHQVDDEP